MPRAEGTEGGTPSNQAYGSDGLVINGVLVCDSLSLNY